MQSVRVGTEEAVIAQNNQNLTKVVRAIDEATA
jgi:hypothetical protein